MSDQKLPTRSRRVLIDEADRLFAKAEAITAKARVHKSIGTLWCRAALEYERAAHRYHEASLGLMARVVYGYAADCFGQASRPEDSARCGKLAAALPAYWEEASDE